LPSGLTGFWSLVSGSGDFTDSLQAETQVLNLSEGENVFQWTILGGFCPDSVDLVIITVACNTPPVIINDTLTVFEDSVLTGSVFNGDFDPDSTALVVDTVLVQEPGNGTFVLNPDGSFTYTPDPDFFGNDTVIVQICDSGIPLPELCDNDTIYIIVLPVNDSPIIVNDEVSTQPGAAVSGNVNDNNSDPEGDSLVVNTDPVGGPGNGTITLNPDGSYTYTPDEGFIGTDTVIIEVCDVPIPGTDSICGLDTLIIVVQLQELFADAGNDTTICGNTIVLNANTPSAGTGQWSVIEGNATVSNSSSPNAQALNLSPGENTFVWTVTENNQSASDTVTITVIDVAPAFAGEDQIICGDQTTLSGSDPENGTVQWAILEGNGVITNAGNQNAIVNGLQPGETVISYTITLGDCFSSDTLLIQVLPEASVALQADTSICPRVTSIQISGQASPLDGSWTVVSGNAVFDNNSVSATASQFSAGENVLVYNTGQSPCAASDTLVITVLSENDLACAGIFIPEGFSPNEDGSNDNFVIFGTENLDVTLKVFNRWGNLVYENNNYQNNWDGTCNQGGVLYGEKLPAGTYYYLVQIQGESGTRKGYLTLWR
jgi:gliding motility-associated-like protein